MARGILQPFPKILIKMLFGKLAASPSDRFSDEPSTLSLRMHSKLSNGYSRFLSSLTFWFK